MPPHLNGETENSNLSGPMEELNDECEIEVVVYGDGIRAECAKELKSMIFYFSSKMSDGHENYHPIQVPTIDIFTFRVEAEEVPSPIV